VTDPVTIRVRGHDIEHDLVKDDALRLREQLRFHAAPFGRAAQELKKASAALEHRPVWLVVPERDAVLQALQELREGSRLTRGLEQLEKKLKEAG
jgi:hypothetical protein